MNITKTCGFAFLMAMAVSWLPSAQAAVANPAIVSAVATSSRLPLSKSQDASRRPAEVLSFLGLQPGMQVADLGTANGYWAEIMGLVVGSQGHVTAFNPVTATRKGRITEGWADILDREKTVTLVHYPWAHFTATANTFDFAIMNNCYHDLYWESDYYGLTRIEPLDFVRALYVSMKHGGIVGVVDHVALPGDTRATVDKLHRIDPQRVKADFEAAGFQLVAQSTMLVNPEDDHSLNSSDPAIAGRTDRFVFKFVKP